MSKEIIKVPDIGGIEDVEVIEVCVSVGDHVAEEDSLIVLESDKASMEIPSPFTGRIESITIAEGDLLSEGDTILEISLEVADNASGSEPKQTESASSVPAQNESNVAKQDRVEDKEINEHSVAANPGQTTIDTVSIPDIGDADNVEIIEVCINVGEEIKEGDSLIVLETDKASMEIPAPRSGKVISIAVKESDIVVQGMPILELEYTSSSREGQQVVEKAQSVATTGKEGRKPEATRPLQAERPTVVNQLDIKPQKQSSPESHSEFSVYAGPSVRRLARDMGVELNKVKGSGPRSRITKDDIKNFVKTKLTATTASASSAGIPVIPTVDFSKFGEISVEPLTKIAKLTAANMQRNWLNVPHVTQFDEADITELEDFRKSLKDEAVRRGVKLTPMPFLLKACASALRANPKLNSSLHSDGESLVYKKYVHLGMAVDTPAGLLVPVVRDADKKTIWELAEETAELAQKAKDRKLTPAHMQGACFTISSLGGIGGQGFTPIVNAPEVAILGVSKLQMKPQWTGSDFVPRKMLPISLSYDHRAINGVDGGRFLTTVVELLTDIRKLTL